jgi:hypothetical protein
VSIDINAQELEGLEPSHILAEYYSSGRVPSSANDYVSMLLRIAQNAFERNRTNVRDQEDGEDVLYHLNMFFHHVEQRWLDRSLDSGPFVLTHGDLGPYNILVDDDMKIVAILDWEWCCVVPLQFFAPPLWLTRRAFSVLIRAPVYDYYVEEELSVFLAVVRDREREICGDELLSQHWSCIHKDGGIHVASALENWTEIDHFSGYFLEKILYGKEGIESRVSEFIQKNPGRAELVARKVREWIAYKAELELLDQKDRVGDQLEKSVAAKLPPWPTWTRGRSIILNILADWPKVAGIFSREGRSLSRLGLGSISLVFIAGSSYLFWKRNIKYLFSNST